MILNKKIVITGASSGIGVELVKILCEHNQIFAVARNIDKLPDMKNVTKFSCDISQPENIDLMFAKAIDCLGRIDIFFANAGFAYFESINEADWNHITKIYNTNCSSAYYSLLKLKEIKEEKAFKFVITASAMSYMSIPGYSLYASTKFALRGFAEAFRYELKRGQSLHMVYPVATYTGFFDTANAQKMPWPRQSAEYVAKSIVKGIKKNKKSIYPSILFRIGIIINKFLPIFYIYQKIEGSKFRKLQNHKII